MSTRTRRASWTFLSSTAFTAVTMLTGLVATPLLLHWLGTERLGTYRAASDTFGFLTLLEFGVGGAISALLARAHARGDEDGAQRILAAAVRWYLGIAAAMLVAGAVLVALITHVLPVGPSNVRDLRTGSLLMLLSFVLTPLATPFRLWAEARQRGFWVNGLIIGQSILVTGAALLFARAGFGITGQFAAVLLGTLAFQVVLVTSGLKHWPGVVAAAARGATDPETRRRMRELNGPAVTLNVCGRLSYFGDNLVVAWLLSPAAVVPLFVTQRLATIFQGQLQGVGSASWAGLAELHHQGNPVQFARRLVDLTGLVAALGAIGGVSIVAFNAPFVRAWVGSAQYGGLLVTVVAACNAYLLAILSLWGWCLTGTGRMRRLLRPTVAQTVVNVAASLALTWRLGIVGPILGTLVSSVLVSAWYLPVLLREEFGVPLGELAAAAATPLALAIPYSGALLLAAERASGAGWAALGLAAAAGSAGFGALWWYTILGGGHRALIRDRVRVVLRRVPA